jgi:DNA-directed RNA polymerase specialized sigma24 family protein
MAGDHKKSGAPEPPIYQFTTTHWSVVVSAGRNDGEAALLALDRLCRTYWYPLFAYVRRRGYREEEARDLTQAFFAQLIAGEYVAEAKRERGRFRTFILTSLDHFLTNEWNRSQAQKRGGGVTFVSVEFAREQESHQVEPVDDMSPERIFERRWAEAVLARTLTRLQDEFDGAKVKRFEHLKRFLTEAKGAESYAEAARGLGLTEPAVKSAIHRLRQRFRELLREEIAQTVATAAEVDLEIRHLLQVLG